MDKTTLNSLQKYFSVLKYKGQTSDDTLKNMLFLVFLNKFNTQYADYITKKDSQAITRMFNCLSKNECLISPVLQHNMVNVQSI